jgi:hypothetical protein
MKTKTTKLLGYLAIDQFGEDLRLLQPTHPRKQLMEKLNRKHAKKQYTDRKKGPPVQTGYIISGRWFTLYEVHAWERPAI